MLVRRRGSALWTLPSGEIRPGTATDDLLTSVLPATDRRGPRIFRTTAGLCPGGRAAPGGDGRSPAPKGGRARPHRGDRLGGRRRNADRHGSRRPRGRRDAVAGATGAAPGSGRVVESGASSGLTFTSSSGFVARCDSKRVDLIHGPEIQFHNIRHNVYCACLVSAGYMAFAPRGKASLLTPVRFPVVVFGSIRGTAALAFTRARRVLDRTRSSFS